MLSEIANKINDIKNELEGSKVKLIAVSKTKPIELVMQAYNAGQRSFGENKVQELTEKYEKMPKNIEWHMIGHLQRNKVKYIAPFVHLIHGIDTLKLLKEINKEARKNDRVIDTLLQVHIAEEDSKFGFSKEEVTELLESNILDGLNHIRIIGLMGMATNTINQKQVSKEFNELYKMFNELKSKYNHKQLSLSEISMGMSGDYKIAIQCGSTMIRIGSTIFGIRN